MDLLQVGYQQQSILVLLVRFYILFVGRIAMNGSDYVERSNVLLTFNATTRRIAVTVDLIDDNLFEQEEDFSGIVTLISDSQRVTISPDIALATIIFDESRQIE